MGHWSLLSQPNGLKPAKWVSTSLKQWDVGKIGQVVRVRPIQGQALLRVSTFQSAGCSCTGSWCGGAPGAEIQPALCQPSSLHWAVSTLGWEGGEGRSTFFFVLVFYFNLMYTKAYRLPACNPGSLS